MIYVFIQRTVYGKYPTNCHVFKCSCICGVLAVCEVRVLLLSFNMGSCLLQPSCPHRGTEMPVSKASQHWNRWSGQMYCCHTGMAGKCTMEHFVCFKNPLLPSEEPQTVCPHGLVTELGCHIHSVHARQGFLCLRKKISCILPGLLNSISKDCTWRKSDS